MLKILCLKKINLKLIQKHRKRFMGYFHGDENKKSEVEKVSFYKLVSSTLLHYIQTNMIFSINIFIELILKNY